jgi:hexosaminidase
MRTTNVLKTIMVAASFLGGTSFVTAQTVEADYHVIPLPQNISGTSEGPFELSANTQVCYSKGNAKMQRNAEFLADYVKEVCGISLNTVKLAKSKDAEHLMQLAGKRGIAQPLLLCLGLQNDNPDAYRITVSPEKGIVIEGASEAGVFYGIQTLRKSIPVTAAVNVKFPAAVITDSPRFAYRGMMLDVCRHFFPLSFIKRYIDILALHNINKFHWHLSEDQGWRIEIKKYPRLTLIGSQRAETVIGHNSGKYDGIPYGGYYTQEQCKEIVRYAAERYIDVIPEIDMPGHMLGALAAYPELGCTGGPYKVWTQWGVSEDVLCAGNPKTITFLQDVLSEICKIFPSKYIHVGGDECPKTRWAACPRCQAKAKELGIVATKEHTVEEQLQSYIIHQAEAFLNKKGRSMIGWDETLEGGLAPNATVMSWRGFEGGIAAARQHHNVIMTPTSYCYFDYYQSTDVANEPQAIGGYVPLEKVYSLEPMPADLTPEEQKYIIGTQANLWTEYIPTTQQVEYMVLPRMDALCEVQWEQPGARNYENFLRRLPRMFNLYDKLGYHYARHIYDVRADFEPSVTDSSLHVTLQTAPGGMVHYTTDGSTPTTSSPLYSAPLKISKQCTLRAAAFRGDQPGRVMEQSFNFSKSSFKPIRLLQPLFAGYKFKGEPTLVDGIKGIFNYKTGQWVAVNGNDLEAVIDMQEPTSISSASFSTCVIKGDWVFDARGFKVSVSDDGVNFREVASESYPEQSESDPDKIYTHSIAFKPVTTCYVKLTVVSQHTLPQWHPSHGDKAFMFVDELSLF